MANTLLAKGTDKTLFLNDDGSGFTLNDQVINLPSTSGTLALATNTISGAGNGLVVNDCKLSVKIKDDEKVLSADENGLASTLSLSYVTTGEGSAKKSTLSLCGKNNVAFSTIDVADFVRDGMIDSVTLTGEGKSQALHFVWNTDKGGQVLDVPVDTLVDTYTAGDGLSLDDHTFSVDYKNVAAVSSLSAYETSAHAASTYATIANVKTLSGEVDSNTKSINAVSGELASFKTSAASTYETSAHAASTYATKTALGDYLTTATASSTYATINSLGDYLKSTDASNTYLAKTDAASEYATIENVKTLSGNVNTNTTNISAVSGKVDTLSGEVTGKYLTKTEATSTYETTANAYIFKTEVASTYVTKALSSENITWSEVTLEKVYDLVKAMATAMGATIR